MQLRVLRHEGSLARMANFCLTLGPKFLEDALQGEPLALSRSVKA
jgi:hypothetical protein